MKRFGVLLALGVGLTIGAHRVIAQQPTPADLEMMKSWSMKMDTDRLTDAKVFTATATAHADDNPAHLYQLILTCDGQPRALSLATFDTTGAPAGMMAPRPIEWQSRVITTGGDVIARAGNTNGPPTKFAPVIQNEVTEPNAIRFRFDSVAAAISRIERTSDNTGSLSFLDIFAPNSPRIDSSGVVTAEQERALGRLQALTSGDGITRTLPKIRLLIADVFPSETVEFNFSTLTPDARSALQKMCKFDQPIGTP